MLLLVDLDNTLIDRAAAFKAWARSRYGESAVEWLIAADQDGYAPREAVARRIADRYAEDVGAVRRTGLDQLVAGWTISEAAGVRKPDRRVFEAASAAAGRPLSGWMVGDHPAYDIGGGAAAGLRTVWVDRGQEWPADLRYRPDLIAGDGAAALRRVIASVRDAAAGA
jgi:putative hydrolase of the HAD superfamily